MRAETSLPSPATAHVLAEIALEQIAEGRATEARRIADDAFGLLDAIPDALSSARVSLLLGEASLALSEAHRARAAFEEAARSFDAAGDRAAAARARVGLARALLALGDASGRAVLEDAGEIYEDLGDEDAVYAIDRELRAVQACLDESPRSFSAVSPRAS